MRARSPAYNDATRAARLPHCETASASGICLRRMRRAASVGISKSGLRSATARPSGTGRRTRSSGATLRISTKPPIRAGAALSACPVPAAIRSAARAHGSSSSAASGSPASRLTARRAAAALAAELPSPEARGIPLCRIRSTPNGSPSRSSSPRAATTAVLLSPRGRRPPSPVTSSRVTPPPSRRRASTVSPGRSTANPSTSNPDPTLATVAGANAVTRRGRALI